MSYPRRLPGVRSMDDEADFARIFCTRVYIDPGVPLVHHWRP